MGYIELCRCEEYGFRVVYCGIGYLKSESSSWGLDQVIIFQETDQLVGDFSLDKGNWEFPLQKI